MAIRRRIAGGRLYFEKLNSDGTYATELEIGEVQNVDFKLDTQTVSVMNHDEAMEVVGDVAITDIKATISFKTTNHSPENLALAMGGRVSTQTFTAGDVLPDFTIAATDVTLMVVTGATEAMQKGRFTFIESPSDGSNVKRVFKIHLAQVSMSDSISLLTKEYAELNFTGEVLKVSGKNYFDEYEMSV